ncbi:MAG: copper oxidase [Candidatus Obscuribacterales bacterium]|nr:copper oxidase [Cyanobacteria bacterium SZAS LIN-5]
MDENERFTRRDFLTAGTALTFAAGAGVQPSAEAMVAPHSVNQAGVDSDFKEFSRYRPSYGGPPDSPHYLGKMMPGLRKSGLPPVPVVAPDTKKLSFRMVNGVKEFRLTAMAVKQELLPGYQMNVWGYNGSCPGPMIEAFQGDRVRIIVQNNLPEPTSLHWHGFELPIAMDGVPYLVQDPIPPGKSFTYEFSLHQTGTFFYHSHVPMQEALGMCGFFIVHPKIAFEPSVDRDFALCYQNFLIPANSNIADSTQMDWNWHTINGRSGPYATPLVVKHGERVRVRLMNFSPMQHHPIHLHGHTFWLTGSEGGRIPSSAWIPRNNTLVGVAMVQDFEFIANNPGDWIFHCHMVHHMMNHMVRQSGPRIRPGYNIQQFLSNVDNLPEPVDALQLPAFKTPGYPEDMQGMNMNMASMMKVNEPRETRGMRKGWSMGVHGLMTVLRVLPEPYYSQVMHSNEHIEPGSIYDAIAKSTLP